VFSSYDTTSVGVRDDGHVADSGVHDTSLLRHSIGRRLVA
jgi:hypothetical protein